MSGATAKVTVVGSINADMRVGVERFPGPGETLAGGEATPVSYTHLTLPTNREV